MGNKTLEESFTGKKPEVSHFRIFGCLTYSHVPSEKRTKFEPTTERGIFVGYDETSNAFRIYLSSKRKVVVRREVRFEEQAFKKSRESEQGEQQVPTPQVASQVSSVQLIGSQVFGVNGPQSIGTGSPVSVVQPIGSSGIGFGS